MLNDECIAYKVFNIHKFAEKWVLLGGFSTNWETNTLEAQCFNYHRWPLDVMLTEHEDTATISLVSGFIVSNVFNAKNSNFGNDSYTQVQFSEISFGENRDYLNCWCESILNYRIQSEKPSKLHATYGIPCSCGIYSYKDSVMPIKTDTEGLSPDIYTPSNWYDFKAVAEVSNWGIVQEYQDGYVSQYTRINKLYVCDPSFFSSLSAKYECPIESLEKIPHLLSSPERLEAFRYKQMDRRGTRIVN